MMSKQAPKKQVTSKKVQMSLIKYPISQLQNIENYAKILQNLYFQIFESKQDNVREQRNQSSNSHQDMIKFKSILFKVMIFIFKKHKIILTTTKIPDLINSIMNYFKILFRAIDVEHTYQDYKYVFSNIGFNINDLLAQLKVVIRKQENYSKYIELKCMGQIFQKLRINERLKVLISQFLEKNSFRCDCFSSKLRTLFTQYFIYNFIMICGQIEYPNFSAQQYYLSIICDKKLQRQRSSLQKQVAFFNVLFKNASFLKRFLSDIVLENDLIIEELYFLGKDDQVQSQSWLISEEIDQFYACASDKVMLINQTSHMIVQPGQIRDKNVEHIKTQTACSELTDKSDKQNSQIHED